MPASATPLWGEPPRHGTAVANEGSVSRFLRLSEHRNAGGTGQTRWNWNEQMRRTLGGLIDILGPERTARGDDLLARA